MTFKGSKTGQETHIKNRFLAELLTACTSDINHDLDIGGGFKVSDIMSNLDTAGETTGFSGVYIEASNTSLMFRAMAAKTKLSPLRSATFAMKKYGLQESWMKAVRERALYVGYKGHIPEIPHPSVETIERHCRLKKGVSWVEEKNILAMLKEASKPKNNV